MTRFVVVRTVLPLRTPTVALMVVDGGRLGVKISSLTASCVHINSFYLQKKIREKMKIREATKMGFYRRAQVDKNYDYGNQQDFRKTVGYVHG